MTKSPHPRIRRAALFPMFLRLKRRLCLLVGAGTIAEQKLGGLLHAGARVRVVAPKATPRIARLARNKKLEWRPRKFRPRDVAGASLVVAATSSPRVHENVWREAQRLGVLCNVADDPPHCDFFYPAVIRRGPLQIAISTGGSSPALAQQLRKYLERQFSVEFARCVSALGRARARRMATEPDVAKRRLLAHGEARRVIVRAALLRRGVR